MKRKSFLRVMTIMLVSTLGLGLSSCSKDDENVEPLNIADAVGTWMCVESSDTSYGETYDGLLVGAQITINSNGTYTSTASSFGTTGSYVVNENTITARNKRGDTFVVKVTIKDNRMTWEGTASTGVKFRYLFNRV